MGSISLMSSQPPKKRGGRGVEEKLVEERRIGGGRKKPQVPVLGLEKDCLPDLFVLLLSLRSNLAFWGTDGHCNNSLVSQPENGF